jgi:hypothetical protein
METLTMSQKERKRIPVMKEVDKHELKLVEEAELLGLVTARRVVFGGVTGRRRCSVGASHSRQAGGTAFREEVLGFVRDRYPDFGPTLAAEYLAEEHGLLGRSISPA